MSFSPCCKIRLNFPLLFLEMFWKESNRMVGYKTVGNRTIQWLIIDSHKVINDACSNVIPKPLINTLVDVNNDHVLFPPHACHNHNSGYKQRPCAFEMSHLICIFICINIDVAT